jgi:hypothetical protein
LAVVYNPTSGPAGQGQYTAYIDYNQALQLNSSGVWTEPSFDGEFTIGKFIAGVTNAQDFVGYMDEIRISDIALQPTQMLQAALPRPTEYTWLKNDTGTWQDSVNWTAGGPPMLNTHTATFGNSITSPTTVVTNIPVTSKVVRFDSAQPYAVAGLGVVNLDADTGSASIVVTGGANAGNHQFQAEVSLADNTNINVGAGSSLSFNNKLSLNGKTLTVQSGTVNINNKQVIGGSAGTGAFINDGAVAGGGTINGDFTSNPGGKILVDIRGPGAVNISGLHVTGTATLAGLLDVTGGYTPTSGSFTVLSALNVINNGLLLTPAADAIYDLAFTPNSVVLTAGGLTGDYNSDGIVNSADYVVWRKNVGTANALPHDPIGGTIGTAQYNQWRANFGRTSGSGSSLAGSAVPEPSSIMFTLMLAAAWNTRRRGSRSRSA